MRSALGTATGLTGQSFALSPTGCHLSHVDAFVVWPRVAKHIRSLTARNLRKYDSKPGHETNVAFESIANARGRDVSRSASARANATKSAVVANCPQLVELFIDAEQSTLGSIASIDMPHLRTLGLGWPINAAHHSKPTFDLAYLAPAILGQPGIVKLSLFDLRASAHDATAVFQSLRSHAALEVIEMQRCSIGDAASAPGPAAYVPLIRPRALTTLISDGSTTMAVAVALAFSPRNLILTGAAGNDLAIGCARRANLKVVHLSREHANMLATFALNPSVETLSVGLTIDPYSGHDHHGVVRTITSQLTSDSGLHGLKSLVFRMAAATMATEESRRDFTGSGTMLLLRLPLGKRGIKWTMMRDDLTWAASLARIEDGSAFTEEPAKVETPGATAYSPASPAADAMVEA